MKVLAFLTDGFETVEALAVIDILRRANIGVDTVSITGNKSVKSAQNIIVEADKLIEDWADENNYEIEGSVDAWSQEQMKNFIDEKNICCPTCGKHNFTDIRQFNLMFKTFQGVTEDAKNTVYLRPETAQGIFVNFKNVQRTSRKKVPFGIG